MAEQESFYDVYKNENNELMFAIRHRSSEPDKPVIIYDGKEHALYYRAKGDLIILDYLHAELWETLNTVDKVLIVESSEDDVEREYFVPVRHVEKLPLTALNVKTPDDE